MALTLVLVAGARSAGAQPGSEKAGWVDPLLPTALVPNVAAWAIVKAREGEIIRSYDELLDQTELRVKLVPHREGPGADPTTLFFSAVFKGRRLRQTPDRVWVRAQSDLTVQTARLRTPSLSLTAGGVTLLNVIDPPMGASAWLNYPCPRDADIPCTFDGVVAGLPIIAFFRLIEADTVFGEALGFPFILSKGQIQMLGSLARELVPAPY